MMVYEMCRKLLGTTQFISEDMTQGKKFTNITFHNMNDFNRWTIGNLFKLNIVSKLYFLQYLHQDVKAFNFLFKILSGCDIATSNGGWSIKTLKGVVSEAGAYLEKNMSDVLDMAEMSPIKEEEEEEEKEEEDLQEDGEKHEEEETEKGNTQRRKVRKTWIKYLLCFWTAFYFLVG